ncbi:MAG: ABC transporter permease [Thermomonas sp.]|uniref:ABC transporter permease n=1 Tax=Thermomonas sp. TaxID=1971895 RepID=UPI001ECDDAB3|nr:FtsX-like permease family protein [Thermomonas sp.]MBV2209892.1 ABC transporter permease [Thermomonas sp.]
MSLHPMIAALRKHKSGVVLIALQIAITLAIVCNAIFIISQRIDRVNRPTGMDESNLMLLTQQWVGAPNDSAPGAANKLDAMLQEDLATLRALPGVASVTSINSFPLLNSSWNGGVSTTAETILNSDTIMSTFYFADEAALKTMGLRLIAGRDFTKADVVHMGFRDNADRPIAIISKALAEQLYPGSNGNVVGKPIFTNGSTAPTTIIGVVERLQSPSTGTWGSRFAYNSTIFPVRLNAAFSRYAIRTQPGQLNNVLKAAPQALYRTNPMRVIDESMVKTFAEMRSEAYRADVGMAVLMGMICFILLAVTAAGIVGLTSFWVQQRTKQIGIRRALGATRGQILHYFQTENFFIASLGIMLGALLAFGLNQLLMRQYELPRLPLYYLPIGALVLCVLGQFSVFGPARRAAAVPPAIATRSA